MARFNKKRGKHIVHGAEPQEGKGVRREHDPSRSDHLTIAWRLSRFDWDGPWGVGAFDGCDFVDLLRTWGAAFEKQTWAEAFQGAGGRRAGNNNHPIKVERLSSQAQRRLRDIAADDMDVVYSFRVSAKVRLYGIRDSRAFQVLWYDPWHDRENDGVCPSTR